MGFGHCFLVATWDRVYSEGAVIHPEVRTTLPSCPRCRGKLQAGSLLWQGIHLCANAECVSCGARLVADLPTGHAVVLPYVADLERGSVHGPMRAMSWLGRPFLDSLLSPQSNRSTPLRILRKRPVTAVVLLNCLDFLYGHSLLKLLNAERHKPGDGRPDLVVVVPECLVWMVPDWVAEIWAIGGPLKELRDYNPGLSRELEAELLRFESVQLSPAYPHPSAFDISRFTGVPRRDRQSPDDRVTFIWREDRLWRQPSWIQSRLLPFTFFLNWQNWAVVRLLELLRASYPRFRPTVLGLGRSTTFPSWIDDMRVESFSPSSEVAQCQACSESRLVVGVHGSNLLLPSAYAEATLDLMPDDRWGNMTEDILYQEADTRLAAWRYRFVSANIGPVEAAKRAEEQLAGLDDHRVFYRT
jgi:hypothetical protein